MKKIILFAFLCLLSLGSKAQIVIDATSLSSCDVNVKVVAIDPVTCLIIASSTPFTILAGTPASYTITLTPAPTVNFIPAAYVSYTCAGASTVLVGPGGPCGFYPVDHIPSACGCTDMVEFPSGMLPPSYPPFIHFPISVHP